MHLSGVLVYCRAAQMATVETALCAKVGVEVHARDDKGKLVVTAEHASERDMIDIVNSFLDINDVIATSIIYFHTDTPNQGD